MALREILEREMEQVIFAGGMTLFSRDGQAMAEANRRLEARAVKA